LEKEKMGNWEMESQLASNKIDLTCH
jgi:hypothetical protein